MAASRVWEGEGQQSRNPRGTAPTALGWYRICVEIRNPKSVIDSVITWKREYMRIYGSARRPALKLNFTGEKKITERPS